MSAARNYILDQAGAEKKLRRMALEIVENNLDEKEIIIAGIRENGSVVARCIRDFIGEYSPVKTTLVDISMDKKNPGEVKVSSEPDFTGKVILVADDVANSGRTLLYALKPFLAYHPKKIETLILVERTHTNFPVRPDYVGLSIATTLQEHIYVEVSGARVSGAYLQ
jgi:pyrimidine operon attenuation protein/uracil phosphoribosyltransferase